MDMDYKQSLAVSRFNTATVNLVEAFEMSAEEALEIQSVAQEMIYKKRPEKGIDNA